MWNFIIDLTEIEVNGVNLPFSDDSRCVFKQFITADFDLTNTC
jgi:hypothetical protein